MDSKVAERLAVETFKKYYRERISKCAVKDRLGIRDAPVSGMFGRYQFVICYFPENPTPDDAASPLIIITVGHYGTVSIEEIETLPW